MPQNKKIQPRKELCAESCAEEPDCQAWFYDTRNGVNRCWFKEAATTEAALSGIWSGECKGKI